METIRIDNFAFTYYYFCCLTQEMVDVGGQVIKFDEPMDCFLWYLDLYESYAPEQAITKKHLMNLVYCWFRQTSTLKRAFKKLKENDLICSYSAKNSGRTDLRKNESLVWISDAGRNLLAEIRNKRLTECLNLFNSLHKLKKSEKKVFLNILDKIAICAKEQTLKMAIEDPYNKAINDEKKNRKQ